MSYDDVKKVWMNGRLVDFADAKIHAFSHVFHYGSAMFEGARVYKTKQGSAAFRIDEHIKRLYDSCKVYRMEVPYTPGGVPGRRSSRRSAPTASTSATSGRSSTAAWARSASIRSTARSTS